MNREDKRWMAKQKPRKQVVLNMKYSDVANIKKQATDDAAELAFFLMLSIPTMVIHDKFGLLMKKEVDGKSREERFCDLCLDLYDSFEKGYVTVDDLQKCLWEESGMMIRKGVGKVDKQQKGNVLQR